MDHGLHAEVHDGHHAGGEACGDAVLSEVPRDLEDIAFSLPQANKRANNHLHPRKVCIALTLLETLLLQNVFHTNYKYVVPKKEDAVVKGLKRPKN